MTAISMTSTRNARWAVLGIFFINGAILANWIARIPDIQHKLNLTEGELGIVLLGMAMGVLTALTMAGGWIAKFGSKFITTFAAILLALALPFLGLAPTGFLLWAALFVFGAFISSMDVAMNAQAVEVERRHGKPIMNTFHAFFSIGGFFGALMGGALAVFPPLTHFLIATIVAIVGIIVSSRPLVEVEGEKEQGGSVFRLPQRALWLLGAIAFAAAIGEGSMADWSTVFLTNVVQTDTGTAALGFASFSLMMTAGRLLGDWLASRFRSSVLVQTGGAIAALGLILSVVFPSLITSLIGFGAVGAGLSFIIPLTFSKVGNMPGISPSAGIAGVATIGYAGFLAGPPVIGLIAELTSLQMALGVAAIIISTLLITGRALQVGKKKKHE